MAQFDIHKPVRPAVHPYFVNLQSDMLRVSEFVVVAPLQPVGDKLLPVIPRLSPLVEVEGKKQMVIISLLAAVPRKFLGPVVGSCADHRDDFIAALDMIFTGA